MSYYALTDSDWPWDDEHEGRAIVVYADTPHEAVRLATEKHIQEFPGAGGIGWKVARLWNVGFEGADWEDDNKPNYDGFEFYPEGCNGPMDTPAPVSRARGIPPSNSEREEIDCVACEDKPTGDNNPCVVCGRHSLASSERSEG